MASEYLKWKYRDVQPDEPLVLTPEQKRKNWWDYHKWHVVLGAVLLLAALSILAHALGLGEVKPDYQVAYVGSAALPEDTASALERELSGLGTDCNGDGRVVVQLNQYVLDGGDAMYAYAEQARLLADLDSRDSYFFLLEDPEGFQESYFVLRRADGSLPAQAEDELGCPAWADCPALLALPLGEYSETVLGQRLEGDSQELLSGLFVARRGFWADKAAEHPDECDALWDIMTKGAL